MTFLDHRELCFVTGKGGVGKTTVGLAVAMAAAHAGRRVVLCELAGQTRAAGLYGHAVAPAGQERRLEDGLWTTTIDPVLALEEWAGRQIGSRRLVGLLTHSNAFAAFVNAAPGARELVSITKAWELGRDERWVKGRGGYDLVVVDGPATGHGVGMLRTPRTFAEIRPRRADRLAGAQGRRPARGSGAQRGRRRRAAVRALGLRDPRARGPRRGRARPSARRRCRQWLAAAPLQRRRRGAADRA
jgi:anion-transporting  ArsA/GET3 family ATPase